MNTPYCGIITRPAGQPSPTTRACCGDLTHIHIRTCCRSVGPDQPIGFDGATHPGPWCLSGGRSWTHDAAMLMTAPFLRKRTGSPRVATQPSFDGKIDFL